MTTEAAFVVELPNNCLISVMSNADITIAFYDEDEEEYSLNVIGSGLKTLKHLQEAIDVLINKIQ